MKVDTPMRLRSVRMGTTITRRIHAHRTAITVRRGLTVASSSGPAPGSAAVTGMAAMDTAGMGIATAGADIEAAMRVIGVDTDTVAAMAASTGNIENTGATAANTGPTAAIITAGIVGATAAITTAGIVGALPVEAFMAGTAASRAGAGSMAVVLAAFTVAAAAVEAHTAEAGIAKQTQS